MSTAQILQSWHQPSFPIFFAVEHLAGVPTSFAGAANYFLFSLPVADQVTILNAMQAAGIKTVRIFISNCYANTKGSNGIAVPDVEEPVGTYNDAILQAIDVTMSLVVPRNMKLIIALHDRYSLGCWESDAYVTKYNIPTSPNCADVTKVCVGRNNHYQAWVNGWLLSLAIKLVD